MSKARFSVVKITSHFRLSYRKSSASRAQQKGLENLWAEGPGATLLRGNKLAGVWVSGAMELPRCPRVTTQGTLQPHWLSDARGSYQSSCTHIFDHWGSLCQKRGWAASTVGRCPGASPHLLPSLKAQAPAM